MANFLHFDHFLVFHLNKSISKLLPPDADSQEPSVFSRSKIIAEYKTPKDDLYTNRGNNKMPANLVRHGSSEFFEKY